MLPLYEQANKDLPTFQYLQKKVAYLLDCEGPG